MLAPKSIYCTLGVLSFLVLQSFIIMKPKKDDERKYWVGFSVFKGVGPKRFLSLLKKFGSAKAAFGAKTKDLEEILGEKLAHGFGQFRESFDPVSYFVRLRENKIEARTLEDSDYPENLKKIDNPPIVLYIKGKLKPQDKLAMAVVGTRLPTRYGKKVTCRLVADLAGQGLTIVSGLAYGVDSIAHKTVLESGGRTIAVLGGGLDKIYPAPHRRLAEGVIKQGALISEFGLGVGGLPGNFPARNRIISGISLGILVTEGSRRSGTKITADWARRQVRPIFAVPGPVTSEMSKAPVQLIKMGAKLVENVEDILEELKMGKIEIGEPKNGEAIVKLTREERKIIEVLKQVGECNFDKIVRRTKWKASKVGSLLSMMEIKGLVRVENGMYNVEI